MAKEHFHSVELQLVGYSWPDPSRYVIEFVVFTGNEEDGYGERIVEVRKIIFRCFINLKSQESSQKSGWGFRHYIAIKICLMNLCEKVNF